MTTPETDTVTRERLSRRVREVPQSGIRKFFDVLNSMPDVISLGVGEPDFDTPERVVEAGVRSLRSGRTHYSSNFGTLELREALSVHLERLYGVTYDPEREIVITVGASEALVAGMLVAEAGLSQLFNAIMFIATSHLARVSYKPA